MTEWDIGLLCWQSGFPVVQHCKVTMSVHCDKSVFVLIKLYILQGRKTPTTNRSTAVFKGTGGGGDSLVG